MLIKLPSSTHGWDNGQQFFHLTFKKAVKAVGGEDGAIRRSGEGAVIG
jgi:hypothetical protein